ncbi:MAG: carboxylesterase family protein [Eubacteriaceae bacterium]|nr:carboxylesterase family protein [Eubacteriaceae bacterium]
MIKQTKVENGWLRGIPGADPRVYCYKGVPFAAPPVGDLRWHSPMPAEDWAGVRDCARFAPISMQATPGAQNNVYSREWNVDLEIEMDEDCLYLNVWTPASDDTERLPVFVWFFGGGLQEGNTQEMEFNGERLARKGIVVVTVNYRVNCFGFLCHPDITAENPDAPANFGYLDQFAGMKWVKRNIAAFGGDPDNITIGGQSAGGGSVVSHLTTPVTEGLFHKAIIMSGTFFGGYAPLNVGGGPGKNFKELPEAEELGVAFFEHLGVKTLKEARELDKFYIRDKYAEFIGGVFDTTALRTRGISSTRMGAVVDYKYLFGTGTVRAVANQRHMLPLLMGNTAIEFPNVPPYSSNEELIEYARNAFGDRADEFLKTVLCDSWEDTKKKATTSTVELGCRCICESTSRLKDAPSVYYYVTDQEMPGWDNMGAFHSSDLWFFFDTLAVCWRPFVGKDYDLARMMSTYWANFMKTGDPNGTDVDGTPLPEWKSYQQSRSPMYFRDHPQMKDESFESDVMKFLVDFNTNK